MRTRQSSVIRLTVTLAMLVAISIVCGKYLAFGIGNTLRFSLESMPVIFAGVAFGPIAGMAVGTIADLIGCLMVGYAINPIVTAGAAAIGLLSGFVYKFLPLKTPIYLKIIVSVFISHFIGSVIIKTVGLSAFYDIPIILLMLQRFGNYLIVGFADGIIVFLLLKSKVIVSEIEKIKCAFKKKSTCESTKQKSTDYLEGTESKD